MNFQNKMAVLVVSHPRSGTHLTLDFIRRNFPAFDPSLRIWQSARNLHVDLDQPDWPQRLERRARRPGGILFQSHMAGLRTETEREALRRLQPGGHVFVYPFRRFSATMRSFAAFSGHAGTVTEFVGGKDRYFETGATVAEAARSHARRWLERGAVFLNVDALLADPERAAGRLGEALSAPPHPLSRRLPRQKLFEGKLAEAVERLRGRESTEVQVPRQIAWASADEPAAIDARFADLHAELAARSIV